MILVVLEVSFLIYILYNLLIKKKNIIKGLGGGGGGGNDFGGQDLGNLGNLGGGGGGGGGDYDSLGDAGFSRK